ncbi:MAG: NADPH-dependent glutamate synthase [Methanomicrobiales archaeon]|jgi:glutamate synthase (NADPH/NADH) small chain|nr:NADPH-dependent glutamate synthase [Methanomicrobiales archaeon]
MRRRAAEDRIHDFLEVDLGMTEEDAVSEANRCIGCKKPLCIHGCPVQIDIPAFIARVAEGDFIGAAEKIKEQNMLPAICGRVCPQETQCESTCILSKKGEAIPIGQLERLVADIERKRGPKLPDIGKPTGKNVAVVGSGPAGLTASAELAKEGHHVTLYESLHMPGGVLTYGIPAFRLPKDIVNFEILQVLSLGVELRTNHFIGRSLHVHELLRYDAVVLATGAGLPYFMDIEGENLNGVFSANEFLTRINLMHADEFPTYDTPVLKGKNVVVVGGGNVAMDAARVARRLGGEVTLVYRRREEDLPARLAEVHHAQEEGISFVFCAAPIRILGEKSLTGIECIRMRMDILDDSGRPNPIPIEGSLFTIEADVVIGAVGQGPNPVLLREIEGLTLGKSGNVVTLETGETSLPHVFAAGDAATGAATVILAMGTGKRAAQTVNQRLKGGSG